jgi:methionyl-tRNA formyltransferase
MAGDTRTGVGLMRMEAGLDTGPVAGELETPISATDTAGDLTRRLGEMAADLLEQKWPEIVSRRLTFQAQSDVGVTYAAKITKAECAIDWRSDSRAVRNQIHGLSPAPGAYAVGSNGDEIERLKFLRVETVEGEGEPGSLIGPNFTIACGSGAIRALLIQRAGRPPARAEEVWRGMKLAIGAKFADSL